MKTIICLALLCSLVGHSISHADEHSFCAVEHGEVWDDAAPIVDGLLFDAAVIRIDKMLELRQRLRDYAQLEHTLEEIQAIRAFIVLLDEMVLRSIMHEIDLKKRSS